MLRKLIGLAALSVTMSLTANMAQAADNVIIGSISELSGAGAAAGTNWRDGLVMGFKEINKSGGILGKKVVVKRYDSQTNPQISRGLVQKAIDEGAFVIMGTVYSSSTVVNMLVAQQNGVPQITGSEAPKITQLGNPYIFRTAFGAQKGMPKIASYLKDDLKVKKVAVAWVNSEFGKGGYSVFKKLMKKNGIEIVADVPSEQGQADFAADIVKIKSSGADAVFVYLTEEESARFLKEAHKQKIGIPLVGETTLIGQKVIDLAGEAANGAKGHVGLSPDAPIKGIKEVAKKFEAEYKYRPDHNAIKGYIGAYVVKYVTEKVGSFDRKKFAETMHGLTLKVSEHPGVLMDVSWDKNGELSRESFLAEVIKGKQVINRVLPAN